MLPYMSDGRKTYKAIDRGEKMCQAPAMILIPHGKLYSKTGILRGKYGTDNKSQRQG